MWLPRWVELLVILGTVLAVAAFFFIIVRVALTGVGRLFRGGPGRDGGGAVRCPGQKCRKLNTADAKYCARCGQQLSGAPAAVVDGVSP